MNKLLDQLEAKLAAVTTKPALMGTTLPITPGKPLRTR